jgi:peroxiredoxin
LRLILAAVIAVSVAVIVVRSRQRADQTDPTINPLAGSSRPENGAGDVCVFVRNQESDVIRALESASTDLERQRILVQHRDDRGPARTLLARARSATTAPLVIQGLAMVIAHFPHSPEGKEAADLVRRKYISDESLDCAFDELEESVSDLAAQILSTAYRLSPHARIKGRAGFALACLLQTRAERLGWRDPPRAQAERARAEALLEEIATNHANLRVGRGILGELVRAQLDELRTLGVGKLAPHIRGQDVDGQPMQLSDYRGKVVVLAFWGNWCSLCRAMFPYERMLVERMKGRPFVLLGVNSDGGTSIVQSLTKEKIVTWRSWKDGGETHGGAIAQRWNVRALPDIFILDARGVIRHHVGPHADDHGPVYLLDDHGNLEHRWQARTEEVLEVAEALVQAVEHENAISASERNDADQESASR